VIKIQELSADRYIDIAIPDDANFNTKETEKPSKFKDLEFEFSRMWRVRTKIVLVPIGVLGTILRGSDQNLQLLSGYPSATELQITLMTTAHVTSHGKCWDNLL
jgi:hypothetical protein